MNMNGNRDCWFEEIMSFPLEILQEIFINLDGVDVLNCRLVSKLWQAAVDGLGDSQWNRICENYTQMYPVYKKVHDKFNLSWHDAYKAITSWKNIKSAKMECRQLPESVIQQFKILPNRMIAVLTNSKQDSEIISLNFPLTFFTRVSWSDTIVYYDIDTFQELERKTYKNPFYGYNENEYLIGLMCKNGELILVQKANNKQEVVGKIKTSEVEQFEGHFGLFGKKLYFQNEVHQICLSELKETEKGETSIETVQLKDYEENNDIYDSFPLDAIAFGCKDNNLTILSYEGYIFEYVYEEFRCVAKFRLYSKDVISKLNEYGIDWTSPVVYRWLYGRFDYVRTSKIPHVSFLSHGPLIVLGTLRKCLVHLFYKREGGLFSYNATPTRTVNMKKIAIMTKNIDINNQIDVVESPDHHLVIVLTRQSVFVLKFGFNATEEIESQEGVHESKRVPAKTKAVSKNNQLKSKAKKVIKKPKAAILQKCEPEHRYNTRKRKI